MGLIGTSCYIDQLAPDFSGKNGVDNESVAIITVFAYPSSIMEEIVSVSFQRTGNSRENISDFAISNNIVLSKEDMSRIVNSRHLALFTNYIITIYRNNSIPEEGVRQTAFRKQPLHRLTPWKRLPFEASQTSLRSATTQIFAAEDSAHLADTFILVSRHKNRSEDRKKDGYRKP